MADNVISLEFVLTTAGAPKQSASDAWARATTIPYNMRHEQLPGPDIIRGAIDGMDVDVIRHEDRINILVTPVAGSEFIPFTSALSTATEFSETITSNEVIDRIGLVVQVADIHKSEIESVSQVQKLIPGVPTPDETLDLYYQVVVRRASKAAEGMNLNKMYRCNTGAKIQIVVSGQNSQQVKQFVTMRYIDVNVDFGPGSDSEVARAVISELAYSAEELYENGYVAL